MVCPRLSPRATLNSLVIVTWGGAILFLVFSVLYFYEACVEWGNVEVPLTLDGTSRL